MPTIAHFDRRPLSGLIQKMPSRALEWRVLGLRAFGYRSSATTRKRTCVLFGVLALLIRVVRLALSTFRHELSVRTKRRQHAVDERLRHPRARVDKVLKPFSRRPVHRMKQALHADRPVHHCA